MRVEGKVAQVDLEAIDRVRETHVAALNRGDVDAWVAVFADDGIQMPPNTPANVGKEMIRSWSQAFLGAFGAGFALSVEEGRVLGDWAFERGTYRITLTPKAGGTPIEDTGKYITLYQRQPGGGWRMARDIWNSNNALPG